MEYKIVYGEDPRELEEEVNELIRKGWKPQGGVCVLRERNNYWSFYQAMVRNNAE